MVEQLIEGIQQNPDRKKIAMPDGKRWRVQRIGRGVTHSVSCAIMSAAGVAGTAQMGSTAAS